MNELLVLKIGFLILFIIQGIMWYLIETYNRAIWSAMGAVMVSFSLKNIEIEEKLKEIEENSLFLSKKSEEIKNEMYKKQSN